MTGLKRTAEVVVLLLAIAFSTYISGFAAIAGSKLGGLEEGGWNLQLLFPLYGGWIGGFILSIITFAITFRSNKDTARRLGTGIVLPPLICFLAGAVFFTILFYPIKKAEKAQRLLVDEIKHNPETRHKMIQESRTRSLTESERVAIWTILSVPGTIQEGDIDTVLDLIEQKDDEYALAAIIKAQAVNEQHFRNLYKKHKDKKGYSQVLDEISTLSKTPKDILIDMLNCEDKALLRKVEDRLNSEGCGPSAVKESCDELYQDSREYVRLWLARRKQTSPDILAKMEHDTSDKILHWLILNNNTPMKNKQVAARELSKGGRLKTIAEIFTALSSDKDVVIRTAIAESNLIPDDLIAKLSRDEQRSVRTAIIANAAIRPHMKKQGEPPINQIIYKDSNFTITIEDFKEDELNFRVRYHNLSTVYPDVIRGDYYVGVSASNEQYPVPRSPASFLSAIRGTDDGEIVVHNKLSKYSEPLFLTDTVTVKLQGSVLSQSSKQLFSKKIPLLKKWAKRANVDYE